MKDTSGNDMEWVECEVVVHDSMTGKQIYYNGSV